MTEFPVPLDNLIAYVKTLHPEGGPLENVSDAFAVSDSSTSSRTRCIGYFVDQARRSGLSWSQIGAAMGVSKQAAQKRFVPGQAERSLRAAGFKPFSRFTDRAVRVLFAADRLAAARRPGAGQAESAERPRIGAAELAAAFLSEPEGLAAKAIGKAGLTPEQVYAAVGAGPAPQLPNAGPGAAERAGLRRFRQGHVQGGAQVGAAHGPQLHRHRAPAARRAVHRRPGRRGASPASA